MRKQNTERKQFLDVVIEKKDHTKIENDQSDQIDLQNKILKLQQKAELEKEELSEKYDRQQQIKFEQNQKKFEEFLERNKTINEKLEEYIIQCKDPSQRQFRFEKFKEAYEQNQLPAYLKNIHEQTDFLDSYNRYDFYQQNYVEQMQNSDMKKEDEQKYWRRNEQDFLKQIINYFFQNLDPEIEKSYHEKKPLTLKAKMLKRIKDYEKEQIKVPGFIEGKYDETSEPANKDFIDTSGQNELEEFTDEDENLALTLFENEFIDMLKKETENFNINKQHLKPKTDFEDMYFLDADALNHRPEQLSDEYEKQMEHIHQFTLRAQLQIYEYYLKGWKIRELCRRFGATPLKIKMIIYSLQNFFETVLPQIPLARACELFYLEDQDNLDDEKKVDYGADLPLLMDAQHGKTNTEFPRSSFRHILKPNKEQGISEEELHKFQLTIKKPQDKLVPENCTTRGTEPYLCQNWIPQKGKGSLKVTRAFKEIIHRSHYQGYFVPKVEKKRNHGPRYMAMGKGYKQLILLQMNNTLIKIDNDLRQKVQQVQCLQNNRISYGTSGFRYQAEALPFIAFRVGFFMSVYAKSYNNKAFGLVITASHNPIKDNGLKIIQPNGEMLELQTEKLIEDFVNHENLNQALKELKESFSCKNDKSVVIVGHDSRPSAQIIYKAFFQAAETNNLQILYAGLSTTPQVYWYVWNYNQYLQKSQVKQIQDLQKNYIEIISDQAREILQLLPQQKTKKKIYVDCSGGIGSQPLQKFVNSFLKDFYDVQIINQMNEKGIELNKQIGAEFVHKKNQLPLNIPKNAKYCVSFDGDADRIIYFNILDYQKNKIEVIDGDKQMALMAMVINKIFKNVIQFDQKLDFIAIMTQYSNFGADKFFNSIQVPTIKTPTGVKYTHHEAVKHDMAVYYESNGHGSLIINQEFKKNCEQKFDKKNKQQLLAWKIFNFHNSLTGDAVFNFLQIELFLRYMNLSNEQFAKLFKYKPHLTYKLKVANKNNCKTDEWKGVLIEPQELALFIENLHQQFKEAELRIFIRSSGTEDVLRVHLEWNEDTSELLNTKDKLNELKQKIDQKILNSSELNQFNY